MISNETYASLVTNLDVGLKSVDQQYQTICNYRMRLLVAILSRKTDYSVTNKMPARKEFDKRVSQNADSFKAQEFKTGLKSKSFIGDISISSLLSVKGIINGNEVPYLKMTGATKIIYRNILPIDVKDIQILKGKLCDLSLEESCQEESNHIVRSATFQIGDHTNKSNCAIVNLIFDVLLGKPCYTE